MSQDTNPSSNPSVALSFNRRTIAVLLAAIVGLTTVFLIMTGGSGGTIAQAATVDVKASSLTDHECDETEWHFVITQIDSADDAPKSIAVTFRTRRYQGDRDRSPGQVHGPHGSLHHDVQPRGTVFRDR